MTEPSRASSTMDADQHHVLAEEVRAYLVSVRGGAPFLSASDGRLLVEWLDQGVPIAAVLSAIERTAHRRAGKNLRTRLTLRACKGEVKKLIGTVSVPHTTSSRGASTLSTSPRASVRQVADRIAAADLPPVAHSARNTLVSELTALAHTDDPQEVVARSAASQVRAFHEALWVATEPMHDALAEQARTELAALEAVVSAKVFTDLVDEHVRRAVRAMAPDIAVEPIWTALEAGAES